MEVLNQSYLIREQMKKKDIGTRLDREFIIGCITISVVVLLFWVYSVMIKWESSDRGTFGDMFGMFNVVFTGFAFVGLVVNYRLQKSELKRAIKEFEEMVKEQRYQREEMAKTIHFQILTLYLQNKKPDDRSYMDAEKLIDSLAKGIFRLPVYSHIFSPDIHFIKLDINEEIRFGAVLHGKQEFVVYTHRVISGKCRVTYSPRAKTIRIFPQSPIDEIEIQFKIKDSLLETYWLVEFSGSAFSKAGKKMKAKSKLFFLGEQDNPW